LAVYDEPEAPLRLNQGDPLADVPFAGQHADDLTRVTTTLGLVTMHSCDCDKFFTAQEKGVDPEILATWPVTVAPAHPPELLIGGQAGDARGGRMPRYFFLPSEGAQQELVVDLWREQAVPARILTGLARQATLSSDMREALYVHLWQLKTRTDLASLSEPEEADE